MNHDADLSKVRHKAVDLLAYREHSTHELRIKLGRYAFDSCHIETVLYELIEKNYLNDARFTEAWIHYRVAKGYGPHKICAELYTKGIDSSQSRSQLDAQHIDWVEQMKQVYQSKYGHLGIENEKEGAKRARFLSYRGYDNEMIRHFLWS